MREVALAEVGGVPLARFPGSLKDGLLLTRGPPGWNMSLMKVKV